MNFIRKTGAHFPRRAAAHSIFLSYGDALWRNQLIVNRQHAIITLPPQTKLCLALIPKWSEVKMEWASLLSKSKLGEEVAEPRDWASYPISAFEKDYNKIVSSAAFRRLQDKTQVFPLDKSDFVRTRLTHSIEVSTVARQLGIMISKNITRYRQQAVADCAEDISSVLLCAGLLHDLGNPPFGHFGEAVIGEWFKDNLGKILYRSNEDTPVEQRHTLRSMLTPQMAADLEHFEGNAPALRLLSKARYSSDINVSVSVNPGEISDRFPFLLSNRCRCGRAQNRVFFRGARRLSANCRYGRYEERGWKRLPPSTDVLSGGGRRHRLCHSGFGGRVQKGAVLPSGIHRVFQERI